MGDLNDILHGLEPSLGPLGAEPAPLEGGITNRNFRVTFGGEEYVVRMHGKDTDLLGISREAEVAANTAAAELGLAPAVAAGFEGGLVTRFIACAPLGAEEISARAGEIGAALRAFHDSGVALPTSFDVPQLLDDYARIVAERGGHTPSDYGRSREVAAHISSTLPDTPPCPCHNDLLPGNLIRDSGEDRIMIVDWEYAGMGHPYFDLGNLSVNNEFDEATDERLLDAYYGARPSDARRAALKLMRVLSDAREGAWGVVQGAISELDFDFAGYAQEHLERLSDAVVRPEFAEWLASAASDRGADSGPGDR